MNKKIYYIIFLVILLTIAFYVVYILNKPIDPRPGQEETKTTESELKNNNLIFQDIESLGIKINVPDTYTISKNINEPNRRGSIVSYDFETTQKTLPYLNEIQFFNKNSIEEFIKNCEDDVCFFGDYPNVERYNGQQDAFAQLENYNQYSIEKIGNHYFFTSNHDCQGDTCVIREYTTFLEDIKIDIWIIINDNSQTAQSNEIIKNIVIKK
ncbi:hypothetical protein KAJ89_01575 [Candidatus Parcubacteria bacterium]|nr:hypothetical protein [Candidatus Parcubacteria bacterium]